jgi:hypothetical protein
LLYQETLEENLWTENRLQQTQDALWSVPIGEDVLKEFLLFSIGVLPSTNFLSRMCSVFHERIWMVLELHPEFEALPDDVKRKVVRSRGPAALALLLARLEVMPSGVKQCQVSNMALKQGSQTSCTLGDVFVWPVSTSKSLKVIYMKQGFQAPLS